MDILLSVPSLLLAIVVVAILGPGLPNAMIAIAITYVPNYARLTRASVLTELSKDYVTASRVAGAGTLRLMLTTVLPNCVGAAGRPGDPQLRRGDHRRRGAGLPRSRRPRADTGMGHHAGRCAQIPRSAHPGSSSFPAPAILITVLAFNLMGDGLRDALDPKLKH